MSIFRPESAEDRMAWVPIIGCLVPLILFLVAIAFIVWRFA